MPRNTEYELMSVDYTETDSGLPGLCFCNDIIVVINNGSFVKSFISFVECDLIFKLNSLSGNKLGFKVVYEDEESPKESIIEIFLGKLSMGYVRLHDMIEEMYYVKAQLQKLKTSE